MSPPNKEEPQNGNSSEYEMHAETAHAVETLVRDSRDVLVATESLDIGALFELLAEPGHRYILKYLLQSEGAVTCSELADYVVDRTNTTMSPTEFRQRVVSELTTRYLPELDEHGYVQYNVERQMISPTDLTPIAEPYLLVALAQQEYVGKTDER